MPDADHRGPRTPTSARCSAPRPTSRARLRPGQLVVLQSTTFPGTTSGPVPRGAGGGSGLVADVDFDLAFAPERVNPGDPASHRRDVPAPRRRPDAARPPPAPRALLRRINTTVHELSSPDAAELAKLLENVFRNVNIALVNQLALLCERMGLDVWEVIDAAATKPFGFMPFRPGPGVGGHCIPVDPYYLSWRAREFDFVDRFVEVAGEINLAMPRHVVDLAAEALNERGRAINGARIGVVGVAFKPNVRDPRNSPAADVIALLRERGADVAFHDPHVERFRDANGRDDDAQRRSTELVARLGPARRGHAAHGRSTGTRSTPRTWSSTRRTRRVAASGAIARSSASVPAGRPPGADRTRLGGNARCVPAPALRGPSEVCATMPAACPSVHRRVRAPHG